MIAHGRVENGVVVLDEGVRLPEGQPVTVFAQTNSIQGPISVSDEQRQALLRLIGICKTDHPPDDEEVERIVEEERLRKYG